MNIGDIHWVDLRELAGEHTGGRRPAMVIQDEKYGGNLPTVIFVPLTSTQEALRFVGTTAIVATLELVNACQNCLVVAYSKRKASTRERQNKSRAEPLAMRKPRCTEVRLAYAPIRMGRMVQPIPPMQKKIPTARPCNEGSTCPNRIAMSVGKMGPTIAPAAMIKMLISVAPRQDAIPNVTTIQPAAMSTTSVVSAPAGNASAVTKRDPIKVSQKIDNKLADRASLTPLSVISVVAQAATEASVGR